MLNKYLLKEYIIICISGIKSVMDLELEFMSFGLESFTYDDTEVTYLKFCMILISSAHWAYFRGIVLS